LPTTTTTPAIAGWFTDGPAPALVGARCAECGTVHFPPTATSCANPTCRSGSLDPVEMSRTGKVWSYTDAQYQPPPPYQPPSGAHEPFAIAAVELEAEQLIVLGQVASGYGVGDLWVGAPVEVVVEPLETVDGVERTVWKWRPTTARGTDMESAEVESAKVGS
jgi:uncharacterized OB-fold protein